MSLSFRKYFFNAAFEWLIDLGVTPYLKVRAMEKGVLVPQEYVDQTGVITLNLSPASITKFHASNSAVSFHTRFNKVDTFIQVPFSAMVTLYGREGKGMFNLEEEFERYPEEPSAPPPTSPTPKKPTFTVVK